MMKLNRIHPVAIICSDYELSKDFYTRILGLKVLQENYRKEQDSYQLDVVMNDRSQIELFSFVSPPARSRSKLIHFSLLALCLLRFPRREDLGGSLWLNGRI